MFIYKAQAESRLGAADSFILLHGHDHPVIWGCECPWDGHRVLQAGKTPSSGELRGSLMSPRPPPSHHYTRPGLAFSHRVSSCCVLVVTKSVGGGREAR